MNELSLECLLCIDLVLDDNTSEKKDKHMYKLKSGSVAV